MTRLQHVQYLDREADNRTYTYDDAGNILSVVEPGKGGVADVAYTYDALGRIETETSAGVTSAYRYDLVGNRLRASSPTASGDDAPLLTDYDALNRPVTMTESGGRTTLFGYDLAGNLVDKRLANGDRVLTAFDARNLPVTIQTLSAAGAVATQLDYRYDKAANVVTVFEHYAPGTLNDRVIFNENDGAGRLWRETIQTLNPGGDPEVSYLISTYEYDRANNRRSKQVETFVPYGDYSSYTVAYDYNNALNQLSGWTGGPTGAPQWVSFSYDANGNRLFRNTEGQATADSYGYDYENRLVGLVQGANGATNGYVYDYRTRRVLRDEGPATTQVAFSGGTSVLEMTAGATSPSARFIRGPELHGGGGVGGLLYNLRGGGASFAYYDHRGDVVMRANGAGVMTYQAAYEAFGSRSPEWGTTVERQKASTKEEDPTGLLNEGMRYRDVEAGVFLTRDPAGFVDGPNVYAYVQQNPWTKWDPEGLMSDTTPEDARIAMQNGPGTPLRAAANALQAAAHASRSPSVAFATSFGIDALNGAAAIVTPGTYLEGYRSAVLKSSSVMEQSFNRGSSAPAAFAEGANYTLGNIVGYTPALEAAFGVNRDSETRLEGSDRLVRGAIGVSQLAGLGASMATPEISAARTLSQSTAAASTAATKTSDFIVTEKGTIIPTSQSRTAEGFERAGFQSQPTRSPGTEYAMPNGSKVRLMEPSGQAGRRASFTNANGGPITPDGSVPQPPRGLTPEGRKDWVRKRTHVKQEP